MQLLSISMVFVLFMVCFQFCIGSPVPGGPENMARPTRPKVFSSPEELRSYLDQLGNFYAIAGRPRFGKRTLAPWMANFIREDEDVYGHPPMSRAELLQILSSANQSEY